MSTSQRSKNTRYMTHLSLLIALQIVLTVTPIGFLSFGGISITIVHIPVLIGAIVLGVKAGAVLGTCFGLSSMAVATFRAPSIADQIFSPFLSGSAWSIVLTLLPRILCGLVAALVFIALKKLLANRFGKNERIKDISAAAIAAAVGSLTNTVLVLSLIYALFGKIYADLNGLTLEALVTIFITVATTNGVFEMCLAAFLCAVLVRPIQKTIGG